MNDERSEITWRSEPEAARFSGEVLSHLLHAGNLDRLESEARRVLSRDPEDAGAHYYLALALIDLHRVGEARPHLDCLLAAEPESLRARIAVVSYFASLKNWKELDRAATEGMRLFPEFGIFSYYAAIADLRRGRFKSATAHIDRARQLAPDDADIANLHIGIHGIGADSAEDSLRRIDDYRTALALDPQNAYLHYSLGMEWLDGLDDPKEAEGHFREAVRLDPGNRLFQKALFQAVAKRSLVYRLFSIPSRCFAWLGQLAQGLALQPWRILFLLIGFKVWLGFFAWLLLVTLVFWPGAKAYEWLLVSELREGGTASDRALRLWYRMRRWPRSLRFALFLAVNLAVWGGLSALVGVPFGTGCAVVGVFAAVHGFFVTAIWGIRRLSAKQARRRHLRRIG